MYSRVQQLAFASAMLWHHCFAISLEGRHPPAVKELKFMVHLVKIEATTRISLVFICRQSLPFLSKTPLASKNGEMLFVLHCSET